MSTLRLSLLLLLLAAPLAAGADADFAALRKAYADKSHLETLALAEAFARDHADYAELPEALYLGGNAGMQAGEYDRAAALHQALLADHADSPRAAAASDELVTIFDAARRLEECIRQCGLNLFEWPDSPLADRWAYMIGQSHFRLWRFKEAEAALKAFKRAHPASAHAAWADHYLARVNPDISTNEHGLRAGYTGKFAEDQRLQAALARLPQDITHARQTLLRTLGVDIKQPRLVIELEDKGFTRDTTRAYAETIAVGYQPHTRLVFYTEHIVVSEHDHRSRVVHELKHAAFRDQMGVAYLDLPVWVREGLAVYGAEQFDDRLAAILGGETLAGRDPRRILNGIENRNRTEADYIEDAAAFLWLESRRKGAVHAFCKRLIAGEKWRPLFSELAGMDHEAAMVHAAAHANALVEAALGDAEAEFLAIRDADFAARRQGKLAAWAKTGADKYRAWLKANPAHPLTANARLRLGQVLVLTGQHDAGREQMAAILEHEQARSSLCDDAQFWIARSHELLENKAAADAAWGVLLRDYPWCTYAIERKDTHKPAGPETAK